MRDILFNFRRESTVRVLRTFGDLFKTLLNLVPEIPLSTAVQVNVFVATEYVFRSPCCRSFFNCPAAKPQELPVESGTGTATANGHYNAFPAPMSRPYNPKNHQVSTWPTSIRSMRRIPCRSLSIAERQAGRGWFLMFHLFFDAQSLHIVDQTAEFPLQRA